MMLGKLVEPRAVLVTGLLLVVACMHNVPQDSKSGADAKPKSAKPMKMESGEAKATGIVTYPGGDRVDWKLLELPEKKKGTLDLTLTWQPPRVGLQLAFDVFDEWNTLIASSKKAGKRTGKIRTASISPATGKYFIRVYAVGRGDAGKYKLAAEFKETLVGPSGVAWDKIDLPDPPKLAAVPENEVGCDEFTFDPKIAACKLVCAPTAPPNWPGCKGKCVTPDINNPDCHATMPCPKPPDKRVKACKPSDWGPCPDKKKPDPENPNCPVGGEPVVGRVIQKVQQGGDLLITVGAGTDQGVGKSWKAQVVRGNDVNEAAVPGGEVTIVRVDKTTTTAKTRLTPDQLASTPYVKFSPR